MAEETNPTKTNSSSNEKGKTPEKKPVSKPVKTIVSNKSPDKNLQEPKKAGTISSDLSTQNKVIKQTETSVPKKTASVKTPEKPKLAAKPPVEKTRSTKPITKVSTVIENNDKVSEKTAQPTKIVNQGKELNEVNPVAKKQVAKSKDVDNKKLENEVSRKDLLTLEKSIEEKSNKTNYKNRTKISDKKDPKNKEHESSKLKDKLKKDSPEKKKKSKKNEKEIKKATSKELNKAGVKLKKLKKAINEIYLRLIGDSKKKKKK